MRIRTPTTSAEASLLNALLGRHCGREPERARRVGQPDRQVRIEGVTPYLLEGSLSPDHPLADSPQEARRLPWGRSRTPSALLATARKGQLMPPVMKVLCSQRPHSTHSATQDNARFPRMEIAGNWVAENGQNDQPPPPL